MLNNFGAYGGMGGFGGYPDMYGALSINPYGGGYGGYNPYQGFQGFGGQGYNPWQGFDYQSFFNQLKPYLPQQQQSQTSSTVGQVAVQPIMPGSEVTPMPTINKNPETTVPQFGNIGQRLDKGKTITRGAEKKLNRMGYSDEQIVQANQGGTGMANFQKNLGAMRPENNSMVSPNTMRAGSNNIGRGPRMA